MSASLRGVGSEVIAACVAEARRRQAISERDLGVDVAHHESVLPALCKEWRLTPVEWFGGGVNPPPLAVITADGTPAVLKLQPPGNQDAAAAVLRAADGRGYVRVLGWDAARGALLTERLGEPLWDARPDLAGQVEVIVPLLRRAWELPPAVGLPFTSKAAGLRRIVERLGPRYGSAAPRALRLAVEYADALASDERPEVVCHGDPHAGNVLRRGEAWALIDPDGFVGERAYDLGVVLRDACLEFAEAEESRSGVGVELLREGARLLAKEGAADAERIWRWGFVERVTTGLYLHWFGYPEEGVRFLATAETIARAG